MVSKCCFKGCENPASEKVSVPEISFYPCEECIVSMRVKIINDAKILIEEVNEIKTRK